MPIPVIFERRTTRRVVATRTTGRLNGGISVRVLDLSLEGIAIESELALAAGQEARLELRHPILGEQISIGARAVWCRLIRGKGAPTAGLLFPTVSVDQRNALRRFVAAEAGSTIRVGSEVVGFLVATAEGMWSVFGANATKIAYVNREGPETYKVCTGVGQDPRLSPRYNQAQTLLRAVSAACMRTSPRLDPPVHELGSSPPPPPAPPPPPVPPAPAQETKLEPKPDPQAQPPAADTPAAPERELQPWEAWAAARQDAARSSHPDLGDAEGERTSLPGSRVRSGGATVGYVALTGADVWSLYDADMQQIGVLSKGKGGYTVFWLGATPESSLAFVNADSFPGAIAVAFELDELPRLTSAPISPTSKTETAPQAISRNAFGSRVVFRKRLIGYVVESAMDDTWAVLSKAMEQVALLTRDSTPPYRFRAVFMGSSVEESMEYFVHETFTGAVAGALSLPGEPLIDPPMDV